MDNSPKVTGEAFSVFGHFCLYHWSESALHIHLAALYNLLYSGIKNVKVGIEAWLPQLFLRAHLELSLPSFNLFSSYFSQSTSTAGHFLLWKKLGDPGVLLKSFHIGSGRVWDMASWLDSILAEITD